MYLKYRQQALDAAQAQGLATFASAGSAVGLRTWLRGAADRIVSVHPEFEQLWDRVLERELKDDTEVAPDDG
jgi:hypothetical protein